MQQNKNKFSKIILIFLFLIALLIIFLLYRNKASNDTYKIGLYGADNINYYVGEMYNEEGYYARDINNKDVTNLVKIRGNVDTSKPGTYIITYSINTFFKKNEVTRQVNVIEDPLKNVDFVLVGSNTIDVNLGDTYQESGVICNYLNSDCSGYVNIDSNVDTNKIGTYLVNYKLIIGGKEKIIKRHVNVVGDQYSVTLNTYNKTNTDVTISVKSNIKEFAYMILPNGNQSREDVSLYVVHENGVYSFLVYDNYGNYHNINVTVDNIDKVLPTGSCHSIISNDRKSTLFNILASDNDKVVKYIHESFSDVVYENSTFTINKRIENSYVRIYDEASNYIRVECSVEYPPIVPSSNIVQSYNSSTLKYWVVNRGTYYESHIWMKDAYKQLKTGLPASFGTLATSSKILSSEINKNNYYSKGIIAVNASGFVSNSFSTYLVDYNKAWLNTSGTPVVIYNGTVLRDFTKNVLPNNLRFITYGLKSNSQLAYYTYYNGSDVTGNIKTTNKMISDGIKYTFGFEPIMVLDGKVVTGFSGNNIRQSIGQIDNNNFILITNTSSRENGFDIRNMASRMVELGCRTAFNLDGGGSTSLLYKNKNTNEVSVLKGSSREIADILYFVEQ